jgi:ferric iron reductase protein FhuF
MLAIMKDRKQLEAKLIEHLEAAQAITDALALDQTGYLVERALDDARAVHWPHINPNVEAFRQPPKNP